MAHMRHSPVAPRNRYTKIVSSITTRGNLFSLGVVQFCRVVSMVQQVGQRCTKQEFALVVLKRMIIIISDIALENLLGPSS